MSYEERFDSAPLEAVRRLLSLSPSEPEDDPGADLMSMYIEDFNSWQALMRDQSHAPSVGGSSWTEHVCRVWSEAELTARQKPGDARYEPSARRRHAGGADPES